MPTNPPKAPEFMTAAEVAERLRISKMQVYRMAKVGELPARRFRRTYRFLVTDINDYIEASRVPAAS